MAVGVFSVGGEWLVGFLCWRRRVAEFVGGGELQERFRYIAFDSVNGKKSNFVCKNIENSETKCYTDNAKQT